MENCRIKFGIITLVISGLTGIIFSITNVAPMFPTSESSQVWIDIVQSDIYLLSYYFFITLGYILPFFGFWSIYKITSYEKKLEVISFWGMMFSIIGTALVLPNLGVFTYVNPVLAESSISIDKISMIIKGAILTKAMPIALLGAVFYTVGPILIGISIWKYSKINNIYSILIIIHGILLSFGFSFRILILIGWVLLFIFGLGLFRFLVLDKKFYEIEE